MFQTFNFQHFNIINMEFSEIIFYYSFDMTPFIKSYGINLVFIISYAEFSQIGKSISWEGKILATMCFSYRIRACSSISRADIEGFKFSSVLSIFLPVF